MAALSPEYRRAWMAAHPVYGSWRSMLCLCGIKRGAHERDRKYYEGVGIYEDWLDYKTFESWAMCNGWKKGLILARRDKNMDFCPENCEWTTKEMNNGWRRNIMRYSDGRSIRDVLLDERLAVAKRLLSGTTAPLGEVARRSGFKSACRLSHFFIERLGVSPAAWRRQSI